MDKPGNIVAMREALVKIRDKCIIYNNDLAEEIDALCGNALAAPPRNCDVGALAEQMERFEAYCNAHEPCESCPLDRPRATPSCGVDWAQMPYKPMEE